MIFVVFLRLCTQSVFLSTFNYIVLNIPNSITLASRYIQAIKEFPTLNKLSLSIIKIQTSILSIHKLSMNTILKSNLRKD